VLELSYNGSKYHGWQVQAGASTVQDVIQQKIRVLSHQDVTLVGCGRTDSGVHARQYFAHVDFPDDQAVFSKKSLNAILPSDICIKKIYQVQPHFHARYDAISRKYIYKIHFEKDPFQSVDSFLIRDAGNLSLEKLNVCSRLISDLEEFDSFVKTGSNLTKFHCKIFESYWKEDATGLLEYHIKANRFVRGMVRLIVGMCVNFALDRISIDQIQEDLKQKRKITKSWSISAEGLSLVEIEYPKEITDLWKRLDFGV
jgi:tRNA pseudouridine38-40 synthase